MIYPYPSSSDNLGRGWSKPRFAYWGHWGIGFWIGTREKPEVYVAFLPFPVGPQGPADGFFGSVARERYKSAFRQWEESGHLPIGAHSQFPQYDI